VRRAGLSCSGVRPTVVCLSVIMNPRQWGDLGPLWLLSHGKKSTFCVPKNALCAYSLPIVVMSTPGIYQTCIYRGLGSWGRTTVEAENREVGNVIQEKLYIQAKGLRLYSSGGLTQNKDTVDGLKSAADIRQSGLTQKYYINGMGTE